MINSGYILIDGISRQYFVEQKTTKTIKYKVYPDLTIKVIVPKEISELELQTRIEKKKLWLKKSIEFYAQNQTLPEQSYKSGSSIKYLGRQYRLKIEESNIRSVKLKGKYIIITTPTKEEQLIHDFIYEWYRIHAYSIFKRIASKCIKKLEKYDINYPDIFIRMMKKRWGSCIQKKNKIILNLSLIKESTQSIEYVIMHELCHLKYAKHNRQFYTLFSIVMPDWQIRKKKLEGLSL